MSTFACALGVSSLAMGQSTTLGPFTPLQISVPPVVQKSTPMGAITPGQVLHLSINLAPSNPTGLKAYADAVSDPKSPSYHKFLVPSQVGQMFGQSASTVQKLVNYFTSKGFTIKLVAQNNMGISADCTAAQAEAAFNVGINNYHAINSTEPGRLDYYSYSEVPQLPMTLAPAVISVEGLQSFTKPHPMANPLTPSQTRTLYSSLSIYNGGYQGQGRHVAISSWDGYRLSNVPLYYKQFNLPTPSGGVGSNITVVTIDGGSGAGTPAGEGDIDIQMVLGMAPLTNFIIYDGGGNLTDVLMKESNDNIADVISESYGWNLQASDATAAHNLHLTMTTQGQTYLAAAGDSGTSLEPYSYPDYDGEVLVVGGTQPNFDSSGNRLSEPCWTGGGGGWSINSATFNVLPSWQVGNGVPIGVPHRLVPDLAFCAAGNNTGAYQFFYNGAISFDYDGTSFASPMFAGMLTIAEQKDIALGGLNTAPHRLGRMQNLIYSQNGRSDVWYDVIEGSNGTLPNGQNSTAAAGWDFTSGWGCMIMDGFVNSIAVTPPVLWAPATVSVFDNTFANPNVVEGVYIAGNAASLANADGQSYSVSPVTEVGLGQIAAIQGNFSTTLTPASAASITINFTGTVPAAASAMVYVFNWKTNLYEILETVSGTQLGKANSLGVSGTPIGNYVSSTGQIQVVVRSIVPTDRLGEVGAYALRLDQLQVATTALLKS